MHIRDYLSDSTGDWPPEGSRPVESKWMEFGPLKVSSGTVWIGDPHLLAAEAGIVVEVPSGRYSLEAKGMDFDGHRRISRLRLVRAAKGKAPVSTLRRGKRIGEAIIDEGMIAVCDLRAIQKNLGPKEGPKLQRLLGRWLRGECGLFKIELDNGKEFDFAYMTPGLGDGSYPLFDLTRDQKPAGVEVAMLGKEIPGWEVQLLALRL